MVLVSLRSVNSGNGYSYQNTFPEALVIDPKAKISLVNVIFERTNDFVINTTNNFFDVRVGDLQGNMVKLGIPTGSYTGDALANQIQQSYNHRYGASGYFIQVSYIDEKFEIDSFYYPQNLIASAPANPDVSQGSELGAYVVASGTFPTAGITQGTANYALTRDTLETQVLLSKTSEGSYAEVVMSAEPPATAITGYGNGLVVGLGHDHELAALSQGAKQIADPTNLVPFLLALGYYKKADGTTHLIVNQSSTNGSSIVYSSPKSIPAGSSFRVGYNADSCFAKYKVANTNTWVSVPLSQQIVYPKDFEGDVIGCAVGADCNITSFTDLSITKSNQISIVPKNFTDNVKNGDDTYTLSGAKDGVGVLQRTDYAGGVKSIDDKGVLSQNIFPNEYTELTFNVPTYNGLDYVFGVCDEGQRLLNVAAGATIGTADFLNGITTNGAGGDAVAPNKNPALSVFQINGKDNTGLRYRTQLNDDAPTFTELVSHADFNTNHTANTAFLLKVHASSNNCQLFVKWDTTDVSQPDWTDLLTIDLPVISNSGINFMTSYGTSVDKSTAGYRYYTYIQAWNGAETATQPTITGIGLNEADASVASKDPYLELLPTADGSLFGETIGFSKKVYLFSNSAPSITGSSPNPLATSTITEDVVQVNVNNLQLRSLTGQAVKTDGSVVGSLTGVSRMIAQVPRYKDDNSISTSNFGPFYYDYFPYSVPLNNATEININDLQVSFTNPDGTLATDISQSKVVLSISGVESMGQGDNPVIGKARESGYSKVKADVAKSQMTPSKS
tara:strand:- start:1624 stop:3987 length:2364 start_codon:yes stop_codon:yes gene_type:complete